MLKVPTSSLLYLPQYLDISHNAWRFCNEIITDGEIKEWSRPRLSTEAEWDWAIHHSSCLKWPFSRWRLHPQPSQDTQNSNCTVIACYIWKATGLIWWLWFVTGKHGPCRGCFLYQPVSSNIVGNEYPQGRELNKVLAVFVYEGPNCKYF